MREGWIVGLAIAGALVITRTVQGQGTVTLNFDPEVGDDNVSGVARTGGMDSLAMAIAYAEGFYVPGSVPNRANNPGDLKIPKWAGDTTGAESISVFATEAEGWQRLYKQLDLIRTGASRVYRPSMTMAEFAAMWTDTQQSAWLSNVLGWLNAHSYPDVTEDTPVGDVLA